ncbi:putative endo xylanase [Tricladium varicosporioides]|nr:putative endo xylanase [Hymenoscyphus varicosporioides]
MHFSPGAPILRSYDLVNWEYFSHSVPSLDFDYPGFDLNSSSAYNLGIYASSLRYHESTGIFYWIGCIQQLGRTYVYTASHTEGPWKQTSVISDYCYYDDGLLIDDDGAMYVSYGKWVPDGNQAQIWVAQLTDSLQNQNSSTVWHTTPDVGYVEGTRFYKINGTYYIWLTNPGIGYGEIVLKSSGGPFGPYDDWHRVLGNNETPVPGTGNPYQGAIIDTPEGDWWYVAFINNFPGGRIPILAPISWDSDGWPNVDFVDENRWGSSYPYPLPEHPVTPITGTDKFKGRELGPQYEWNHNPDNSKWSVGQGLNLQAATVTDDFFMAQNTLSHRILGPNSTATIQLDYSLMMDGDNAGLVIFRYDAAWIGVSKSEHKTTLQMVDNISMNDTTGWHTTNKGNVIASTNISGGNIWLRVDCDISGSPGYATFSYSHDGTHFSSLGQTHSMADGAVFFVGDRYGIFNYATKKLGGQVIIKSFAISTQDSITV